MASPAKTKDAKLWNESWEGIGVFLPCAATALSENYYGKDMSGQQYIVYAWHK
jgi:hypothetical protein